MVLLIQIYIVNATLGSLARGMWYIVLSFQWASLSTKKIVYTQYYKKTINEPQKVTTIIIIEVIVHWTVICGMLLVFDL